VIVLDSSTTKLSFNYFLGTEGLPFFGKDIAIVEISDNNGAAWTAIAGNNPPLGDFSLLVDGSGAWQHAQIDVIAFAGSEVQLRFGFNSGDGAVKNFAGFYIDDISFVCDSCSYDNTFEAGPAEWSVDNAFGNGNGQWRLATDCDSILAVHSLSTSFHFGQAGLCHYDNGSTAQGVVVSPPIDLDSTTTNLNFNYFLGTEFSPGAFDIATVEVSDNDGASWTLIAQNAPGLGVFPLVDSSGTWQQAQIDIIDYAGSEVQFRFGFDTVGNAANGFVGFYFDDILFVFCPAENRPIVLYCPLPVHNDILVDPLHTTELSWKNAQVLYASNPKTNELLTVDPPTGLATVVEPFTGADDPITEIEWSPDGTTLYATTGGNSSTIHTIDPVSGTIIDSVNHTSGNINGLEFDAAENLLGTKATAVQNQITSQLVVVDPNTGNLTVIGIAILEAIGGLAFDPSFSTLYGITCMGLFPPCFLASTRSPVRLRRLQTQP